MSEGEAAFYEKMDVFSRAILNMQVGYMRWLHQYVCTAKSRENNVGGSSLMVHRKFIFT